MSCIDKAPDLALEAVDLQERRLDKPVQVEAMNIGGNNEGNKFPRITTRLESTGGGNDFGSGGPEGPDLIRGLIKVVAGIALIPALVVEAISKVVISISMLISAMAMITLIGISQILRATGLSRISLSFAVSAVWIGEDVLNPLQKIFHYSEIPARLCWKIITEL